MKDSTIRYIAVDGQQDSYLFLFGWRKYQKPNHPSKPSNYNHANHDDLLYHHFLCLYTDWWWSIKKRDPNQPYIDFGGECERQLNALHKRRCVKKVAIETMQMKGFSKHFLYVCNKMYIITCIRSIIYYYHWRSLKNKYITTSKSNEALLLDNMFMLRENLSLSLSLSGFVFK